MKMLKRLGVVFIVAWLLVIAMTTILFGLPIWILTGVDIFSKFSDWIDEILVSYNTNEK